MKLLLANEFVKTVITAIENKAVKANDDASELPLSPIQLSVLSEEAAPVYREPITSPYNTENAEDLQFQTDNQKSVTQFTPPPYLKLKSSCSLHTEPPIVTLEPENETAIQNTSAITSTLPTASPIHTQPTKPVFLPQEVLTQVLLTADPIAGETLSASSAFSQVPSESHSRSPKVTLPPTKRLEISTNRSIYVPPSGTSITPPLTHSSSFESAIGFWRSQISIPTTSDIIPSPEPSPYTTTSDTGVPLPIPTPQKCKK